MSWGRRYKNIFQAHESFFNEVHILSVSREDSKSSPYDLPKNFMWPSREISHFHRSFRTTDVKHFPFCPTFDHTSFLPINPPIYGESHRSIWMTLTSKHCPIFPCCCQICVGWYYFPWAWQGPLVLEEEAWVTVFRGKDHLVQAAVYIHIYMCYIIVQTTERENPSDRQY